MAPRRWYDLEMQSNESEYEEIVQPKRQKGAARLTSTERRSRGKCLAKCQRGRQTREHTLPEAPRRYSPYSYDLSQTWLLFLRLRMLPTSFLLIALVTISLEKALRHSCCELRILNHLNPLEMARYLTACQMSCRFRHMMTLPPTSRSWFLRNSEVCKVSCSPFEAC